jgi:hypothetical protein
MPRINVSKAEEPTSEEVTLDVVQQLHVRIDALETLHGRVSELADAIGTLDGYERIARPLQNGLSDIVEELKAMRPLNPSIAKELDPTVVEALGRMRVSLAQPKWDGVKSIPIVDGLPFIGEAVPDQAAINRR